MGVGGGSRVGVPEKNLWRSLGKVGVPQGGGGGKGRRFVSACSKCFLAGSGGNKPLSPDVFEINLNCAGAGMPAILRSH